MSKAKYLLWVDLETTGTDETRDQILEIGAVITRAYPGDSKYWVLHTDASGRPAHWTKVLQLTTQGRERIQQNETVLKMHRENGLLDAVMWDHCVNAEIADRQMSEWLASATLRDRQPTSGEATDLQPRDFMLAGSGVAHFDRRFINAYLPSVARWLDYPALDIGVTRRQMESVGVDMTGYPVSDETKPHRAMDDILLHIKEAEWQNDRLRWSNEHFELKAG